MNNNELGKKIARARAKKNLSLRTAASKMGISHNTLFLIEQGKRFPKIQTLKAIASVLGLKEEELLKLI